VALDARVIQMRAPLQPDERVVIVTVGGSGVGEALLRRVIASYPDAARRVNGLRMIAVAGPRIDPATLGAAAGVVLLFAGAIFLAVARSRQKRVDGAG